MVGEASRVAFFGSMTLLAKEIRSLLEDRAFPAETVKLYDIKEEGTLTDFAGEALAVTRPDEEALIGVDIAFMCGSAAETAGYLDWPSRRGFVAIDLSGASRGLPGVPLVHTEVNPDELAGGGDLAAVIGAPHAISHNLASLVGAARTAGSVRDVEALALRPASDLGGPGIEELYQQTVALLNFSSVPQEVFGRQMAFNLVPSIAIDASRVEGFEDRIHEETVRLLGVRPDQASIRSAFCPTFHSHILSVTLTFERPPELTALKESFATSRGLKLVEDPSLITPLENAGEQAVVVVDVRPDPHRPGRVRLWSFCDNLKGGAALNAVRIAERVADLRRGHR